MVQTGMIKVFYGGGGILKSIGNLFGGGQDDIEIKVPEPPKAEDTAEAERKRAAELRAREAANARNRVGRQRSLLTGTGSTASAPTAKATLLGRAAKA
jgi:hypothetical protein